MFNLKTGELIKKDIETIFTLNNNRVAILKEGDKYYYYDGKFKECNGVVTLIDDLFYEVLKDASYSYYYADGTLLFTANQAATFRRTYGGEHTIYVFSYNKNGNVAHKILKVE